MSTQTEQLWDVTQTESGTNHIWWDVPIGRILCFCFDMWWLFQYSWNLLSCSWTRGGQSQLKTSLCHLLEFKGNSLSLWICTCEVCYLGWRCHGLSQLKLLHVVKVMRSPNEGYDARMNTSFTAMGIARIWENYPLPMLGGVQFGKNSVGWRLRNIFRTKFWKISPGENQVVMFRQNWKLGEFLDEKVAKNDQQVLDRNGFWIWPI